MEVAHIWMPPSVPLLRGVFPRQNFIYFVSFFLLFFPWLIEPGSLQSEKKILQSLFLLIVSSVVLFFQILYSCPPLHISGYMRLKRYFAELKEKNVSYLNGIILQGLTLKLTNYNK